MPLTCTGSDMAMMRNDAVGRLDFQWGTDGNPVFDDNNVHRVLSLLIEHRPSPGFPGWWADETGTRGSLIYTVKNALRSTPSDLEGYALDALQKAINEKWITDVQVKAFTKPVDRARIEVRWKNPGGLPVYVRLPLTS